MSTEQEPDQLQVKQQLLKAEIIDKNLDQMKFLQYCISQKENGDDLNNWTLEELKTCVNNFQESLKPKQSSSLNFFLSTAKSNTQPQPQPQTQPQQIQFQQYPQNMQYPYPNNPNQFNNQPYQNISPYQQNYQQYNQPYQQFNPSFQQQYNPSLTNTPLQGNQIPQQGPALIQSVTTLNPLQQMLNSEKMQQKINTDIQDLNIECTNQSPPRQKYEIICKKAEKTVLNDKNIKVVIQNPKTTEKSLLTSQFTIYEVCTESMHWLVHRRYSDFDWLRTILCKFFPRILIPPIPGKKVGNRRFEEDFI